MDSYSEMYCRLFNKITDVIHELEKVQRETEELFLSEEKKRQIVPIKSKESLQKSRE